MTGKRTRYSAEFKAKVALEALRGELMVVQLAAKHGIHHAMVGNWKWQAVEGMAWVFSGQTPAQEAAKSTEAEVEKLHAKVGQLLVERDFWRQRPDAEPGATTADDRARSPGAAGGSAVRVDFDQPLGVLLPAPGRNAAEPG
jgi:transposase